MKKTNLIIASSLLAVALAACNSGSETSTTTTTTTDSNNASTNTATANPTTEPTASPATASMPPLTGQDSTFMMKAAEGGMMEVESGNVALQNATNERVKAFANMMVADHTKANDELKARAAEHGMTLPAALPEDKQKHIEDMKKMTGKAFDKHYISMMMNDHKNAIADFEKQASSGTDQTLKDFASKTLPTLKMHRDSVTALSKMKM